MPKYKGSSGELALAEQLRNAGIRFEQYVQFDIRRKWELDFVLPQYPFTGNECMPCDLAIEVQGGLHTRGRHNRTNASMEEDFEKIAAASMAGYIVILCSTQQAMDGTVLHWLQHGSDCFEHPTRRKKGMRAFAQSVSHLLQPSHEEKRQAPAKQTPA